MEKDSLNQTKDRIVESSRVSCRDCYRCLRVCPVKAISVSKGQTQIVEEKCIRCGACVRECFIHVRHTASDFRDVQQYIKGNRFVVASVDPAFPALFKDWRTDKLAAALRALGFTAVHEAAEAIPAVERSVQALGASDGILPNCSAVVNYVERYFPELTDKLLPVASPMIAPQLRLFLESDRNGGLQCQRHAGCDGFADGDTQRKCDGTDRAAVLPRRLLQRAQFSAQGRYLCVAPRCRAALCANSACAASPAGEQAGFCEGGICSAALCSRPGDQRIRNHRDFEKTGPQCGRAAVQLRRLRL